MNESGNYLYPTFNGNLWPDKPTLSYWLMSLSIKLFGNSEFACRFWSAIGTSVSCLLTFLIAKRLFGIKEGLLAMAALASSAMMLVVGTMAIADGITLPLILGAMTVFVYAITSRVRYYHIIFIGVLMGLGMLAKGPIGLLPLPVMLITLWFTGKNKGYTGLVRKLLAISVSSGIAVAIFLAWAVPANRATGGQFLSTFIGRDVINRALHPMEHHGGNFLLYLPYYLPVIIAGFFPWIMFLPGAFSALIGNRLGQKPCKKLLLVWTISVVVIMTLAATKLPHYIIFIWPALALLSAAVIAAFQKGVLTERDAGWLSRGNWFFVPVGLAVGAGLIAAPFFMKIPSLIIPTFICSSILLLTTFIAASYLHRNRVTAAAKLVLIGMIAFHIPYLFGVLPVIERTKVTPDIAKAINNAAPLNTPVATYKFGEPSMNYYLGRNLKELSSQEDVVSWIRQKGPAVLVIPGSEYEKIRRHYSDLPTRILLAKKGLNYSKGRPIELLALLCSQGTK